MFRVRSLLIAVTAITSAAVAQTYAVTFTPPAFVGQANSTLQEWQGFTTTTGQNTPTTFSNSAGAPVWFDSTSPYTSGNVVLLLGANADNNFHGRIYSPTATLHPQIDVPLPSVGTGLTQIVLQAAILVGGNELDLSSFVAKSGITTYLPTSITSSTIDGNIVYNATWSNLPATTAYTLNYAPLGTSSSQVAARVDTVSAVPEPATLAVAGLGGLLLIRRRQA